MKLWIARSKKGALNLYYTKPKKFDGGFFLRSRYDGEIISWDSYNTEGGVMTGNFMAVGSSSIKNTYLYTMGIMIGATSMRPATRSFLSKH